MVQTGIKRVTPRTFLCYPHHVCLKGNVYYFRFALPKHKKNILGGTEVQLSLRTPYLREAKLRASKLHTGLAALLEEKPMLQLKTIKEKLTILLLEAIELQGRKLESIANNERYKKVFEVFGLDEDPDINAKLVLEYVKGLFNSKTYQEIAFNSYKGAKVFGPESHKLTEDEKSDILSTPFSTEAFFSLHAEQGMESFTRPGFFTEKEFSENKAVIGKLFIQFSILFYEYVVKEESGDLSGAQALLHNFLSTMDQLPQLAQSPQQVSTAQQSLLFSEAMEKYIEANLRSNKWKTDTVRDIKNRLSFFIKIIGDKPIQDIIREDMRLFVENLQRLPPNHTKFEQYVGKSISEIIDMSPEQTLSVKTINTITGAVAALLGWCVQEGLLSNSPAQGLQIVDPRHSIDLRHPFSLEDLGRIFVHPKFAQSKFKHPSYYWLPLIALFTGMRLEEIAQLHCVDIKKFNGVLWIIDINEVGVDEQGVGKKLKNKNAHRVVPVHRTLIELGLLDYLAHIERGKNIRLFPELSVTDKTTEFGKQPGKQFSAVVKGTLDKADKKSFHSLRHTFADFYKQRGMQTDFFRQLYGHDIPELAARQYGSKFPPDLLYREVIEKLDYGLDLSHLINTKFRYTKENQSSSKKISTKESKGGK